MDAGHGDEQLADLADRIARGEAPDLGDFEATNSGGGEALQRLLPAMRLLSELAHEDPTEDRAPWLTRPPEALGDFQIGREIGRGGIGVVYEATQISLGRRVAVKVLPPPRTGQRPPRGSRRPQRRLWAGGDALRALDAPAAFRG
jgi:serine/threonine protein kinase